MTLTLRNTSKCFSVILGSARITPSEFLPRVKWCLGAESNHPHGDFQSPALPTELPRHVVRVAILRII